MLDLFSGSGSASAIYREAGWEVYTLDKDPRWGASIQEDVLSWAYRDQFPPGFFHTITCAPPCTEFSRAKTTRPRDIALGDMIVQKTLDIIQYFRPIFCWLENPRDGLLRTRPYMQGLPFVDADYC